MIEELSHVVRNGVRCAGVAVDGQAGVEIVEAEWSDWGPFSRGILTLNWLTEPGWINLRFQGTSSLVVIEEIGGRVEICSGLNDRFMGEYFGAEHSTFVKKSTPALVYADEMRRAKLVCCVLSPFSSRDSAVCDAIEAGPSRYMVHSHAHYECSRLFGTDVADDPSDVFASTLSRTVLLAWAAEMSRPQGKNESLSGPALGSVLSFIRDELDRPISLAELAHVAGLPPKGFGILFREATGKTPQAWQLDARVRNAQRLMFDDPGMGLSEIAVLCGFSDQSHFSRGFLKVVGRSPTEWLTQLT